MCCLCRRESNKTREDIQVLGLALEVRKIEEQLGHIDKRCAKLADVVVNPTTGLPIPKISPLKKQNKHYAALTGKVGQLAKQMVSLVWYFEQLNRNDMIFLDGGLFVQIGTAIF